MIFLETLNGTKYNLKDIGLIPLNFILESPSPRHLTEEIEGRNGFIDLGTTFEGRVMQVKFLIKARDLHDHALLRNEVFKLFNGQTPFYLINKQELGKRWKVKTASSYSPERLSMSDSSFEISFISASPYAESYGTTLNQLTYDEEVWQYGQGLIIGDINYTHSASAFSIFNAGDITIDPRELPLRVIFQGASNKLRIKNNTTGDVWSYKGTSTANDRIVLDGIRSLKNDVSVFKDTNKKLITIVPGWNEFEITGASVFLITFDFRFYYL